MEEKTEVVAHEISRRGFIAGAGVSLLGAAGLMGLAGCSSAASSAGSADSAASDPAAGETFDIAQTVDCDVAVIGAGASGISCAVHCAESGLKVALIEKTSVLGGASNSTYSAMVRLPEEAGAAVDAWVTDCHWRVDATAIGNILANSSVAFGWLHDKWGWSFSDVKSMGVANWKIGVAYADRPALYQTMVEKSGVDAHLSTTAKQLVQADDGTVTGVIAVDTDKVATQFDAKDVVIATGGYAGNADMVQEAFGRSPLCGGLPQNVGEGLEMCWAAGGAKPDNYGMQMPHQTYTVASDKLASKFDDLPAKYPFLAAYAPCFLNVTAKGRRFRNEGICYNADAAANSSIYQGDFHWTIVSASQMALLEKGGLAALGVTRKLTISPKQAPTYEVDTPWADITRVFDQMVTDGTGFKGASAKELAQAAGMDADVLAQTITDYDKLCAAQLDTQCGKDAAWLIPCGSGPYYAIDSRVNNLTSCGGVCTDTDYRVLDAEGNPVKGLFAIGVECMSNLFSDTYSGVGAALCTVYTTGYLTAEYLISAK